MGEVIYGQKEDFVFQEAVNFLKDKKALPAEVYKQLDKMSRTKAFTVSGYTSLTVLQEFLDSLTNAIKNGTTVEQFREQMNHFLSDHGYEGINPWQSDVIFRTNIQTAYNVGHFKSMTEPTTLRLRPYWQYITAGDGHVRDTHALMEGKVYRADDPIWDVWYPPNGFRCRCMVVSLSKGQVERMGIAVETQAPHEVDYTTGEIFFRYPDKGFSGNPAKAEWQPDMSKLSPPLKKILKQREKKDAVPT